MLTTLINDLIKTVNDLVNHAGTGTVLSDVVVLSEDVVEALGDLPTSNVDLVADIVQSVIEVARAHVSPDSTVGEMIAAAEDLVHAFESEPNKATPAEPEEEAPAHNFAAPAEGTAV